MSNRDLRLGHAPRNLLPRILDLVYSRNHDKHLEKIACPRQRKEPPQTFNDSEEGEDDGDGSGMGGGGVRLPVPGMSKQAFFLYVTWYNN